VFSLFLGMQCEAWLKINDNYIFKSTDKAKCSICFDLPEIVQFENSFYTGANSALMRRWISAHSDTSITCDDQQRFFSNGTFVYHFQDVLVDSSTIEIFDRSSVGLVLCDTSHHNEYVQAWNFTKNSIDNMQAYLAHISTKPVHNYPSSRSAFILNTKWSDSNFYHWFHEAVPRIQAFLDNFGATVFNHIHPVWLSYRKPTDYQLLSLQVLGVDLKRIQFISKENTLIHFKNLLHSTFVHAGSFHPKQLTLSRKVMFMLAKNCTSQAASRNQKLLVLRRHGSYRFLTNYMDVIKTLSKHDFLTVYFEDMSVGEQVALAMGATNLVGIHGAGMTHLINMNKMSRVTELMPSDSIHPLYWYLAALSRIQYSVVPCKVIDIKQQMHVNTVALLDSIFA